MNKLFKQNTLRKMPTALRFAPWILLVCVFSLGVFILSESDSLEKETNTVTYLTKEKGASLIHSFEATLYSSIIWTNEEVENILIEQANRDDIHFLAIVDKDGIAVVASDSNLIGKKLLEVDKERVPSSLVNGKMKDLIFPINKKMEKKKVYLVNKQLFVATTSITRKNNQNNMMRRHRYSSKMHNERNSHAVYGHNRPDSNSRMLTSDDTLWNIRKLLKQKKEFSMIAGFNTKDIEDAQIADDEKNTIQQISFLFLSFLAIFSFFILRAYQKSYTMTQEGRAYILSLMDALPLGIITLDQKNTILTMNQNSELITKHKEVESVGKNITELIPQLSNKTVDTNLKNMTITLHPINENPICVEVNTFPIIANDENNGLGIILRDLREIQNLQEELHRQERLASIGKLAAGIAHEIRNPLGSIKGLARLFEESAEKDSEDAKLATIMTQEVMRVDKVVSDLLELSKPNTISIQKVNLKQLIEKGKNTVLHQSENNISFIENFCEQCEDVFLDEDRMIQVLQNLFLNAIQGMPKGGVIHVESTYIQEENIIQDEDSSNINNTNIDKNERYHDNVLEITISDNGKGIAEKNIKNLFTPYYTDKADGTGLGLVMVQKIIQAHNGTVSIESKENVGTKITLRMPQ